MAVLSKTMSLTYKEVYEHAAAVNKWILSQPSDVTPKPGQLVGVLMTKGWEQVVSVLGILLAGGAYLPIDPDLPSERVSL